MGRLAEFDEVLGHIRAKRLSPVVDRVLPLSEVDASAVPYFSLLLVRRPDPAAP